MVSELSNLFTTIFYRILNIYIQQVLDNLTTNVFYGYYTSQFNINLVFFRGIIDHTPWYIECSAHGADTVFVSIYLDNDYFRPIMSAACFKMSFSISSCLLYFRSWINSFCSSLWLSCSLKDLDREYWFTHLGTLDGVKSYFRMISPCGLPDRIKSTICFLNCSIKCNLFNCSLANKKTPLAIKLS